MLTHGSRLPYYRIAGYATTLILQGANNIVMLSSFRGEVLKDPNIQLFALFMFKFVTIWNVIAQMIHAALGLSCDLLSLSVEDHKFVKPLKYCRDVLFDSIVVPYSLVIPTIFWPLFNYDRELVLPYYTTKIVNSFSNHIMHSAIVPAVLWEMMFQPRQAPKSHKLNIALMSAFAAVYLKIIFDAYFEIGVFPYPILKMLYGSVFLYLFLIFVLLWLPIYYYLQWPLSSKLNSLFKENKLKKYC